ncbi:MAG: PD-(D/E)XK nuclease family protein [Eubacteriales bacterium]|nr:PD-(D/E)XK nuclease family protein [Eubacteriales bacterium]
MSVTVIKGRSGSGKSRYMTAHIKSLIKDPFSKIIVLVPGQLTFETEKSIMKSCQVDGIFGLQVMSIQRLACKILEDTGECAFMTNAAKTMACARALLSQSGRFGGAEKLPDMDACAADLISRLKSYNQTPGSLRDAAAKLNDAALSRKLFDTADLYERYIGICKGRIDTSDMYALAAARADEAAFLRDAHVMIDGLDSYSPAVMRLLEKVMALGVETLAAFRHEGGGSDKELFASEERDIKRFIAAAKKSTNKVDEITSSDIPTRYACRELEFLEANLYRYPYQPYEGKVQNVQLFEADDMLREVDILATNILAEIKQGRRFRDMAVVGGGIDAYLAAIKTKFALCGIPYFIDERRSLADNTFFNFLYNALCAAAGDMTAVTGYVYSGYAPLTPAQKMALRRFTDRYAYRGWHYMNRFWDDGMESLRNEAMSPLFDLSNGIKEKSGEKQIAAVRQFLKTCGVREKLEVFCDSIDCQETLGEHAYFSQVYEKSAEVLDGIGRVFGDTPIAPQTLCDLVKTGFAATKIAVIPPTTDEIGVFDISVARLPDIDVLFAIGVHDGVWPAKDDGPGLLSAAERDTLCDAGFDIGVYDLAAEKLKIYSALVKPKQRLYLSYHTSGSQPSILIDRIKRLFPLLEKQKQTQEKTSLKGMRAAVLAEISEILRGKQPAETTLRILSRFLAQPEWREKAARLLLRTNAALPVGQETALALYGGIRCSATRIENYYKCPFRHFIDHGIKAERARDYVSDKADIGTYMHLALDIFTKTLIGDRTDIKALTADDVRQRMKTAAQQAAEMHDDAKLLTDERFLMQYALITQELINTAGRIRAHFLGSNASIYSSEQVFSDYAVGTVFGDVVITGKIDRIDIAGRYFRVVDYKSSATGFSIRDFAGGVALQLPVYIEAAKRLMGNNDMQPAGGYYMRIGDAYKEDGDEVARAARMAGISLQDADVLSAFSAVLQDGSFAAIDQSLNQSGALSSRGQNRYFSPQEMDALLASTNGIIKAAAEDIYRGNTAISPATGMTSGDACTYCDYASVCMKNTGYDGNCDRPLEPFDKTFLEGCDER